MHPAGQASLPKQAGKQTAEMWTVEVSPTRGAVAVTFKKSSDFVAINRSARLGVCMEVRPKGLQACLSNFVVRAGEEVQYGWSEPHEVRDVRRTEHFVFPELGLTLLLGQTGTGSVLSLEDLKDVRRSGQESVSNKGTTRSGRPSETHKAKAYQQVKISKAGISIIEEKPPPGLLEGQADASYGATSAPEAQGRQSGDAARLSPEEVLNEVMRNADEYAKILLNAFLKGLAPLLAEALGTFALVFTVGCVVTSPTPSPWSATSIASVLMVMVYATGPISGGHLNPAVTFAMALVGKKSFGGVMIYWLFQFTGAFMAAAVYKIVCAPHLAVVAPVPPFSAGYAAAGELLYTSMLVFVVLCCAVAKKNTPNQFYGLAIGFVVLAGGHAVGRISGAALNPAVSVALGLGSGKDPHWALVWFAAELAGAALAAGVYRILRPEEFGKSTGSPPDLRTRCLAEAFGTFMLVVTVGLNIVSGSRATAYSAAAALMCMIYSLGNVSGAHFNPAVTLAVLAAGRERISRRDAGAYIVAQLAGGLLAGLVYAAYHIGSAVADKSIKLVPGRDFDLTQACIAELITTMFLGYVVLCIATVREPYAKDLFGLVVASAVTGGSFAVGSVSGGELNPSVTLGLMIGNVVNPGKGGIGPLGSWLAFIVSELAGGLLAAGLFRLTHRKEFLEETGGDEKDDDGVKGLEKDATEGTKDVEAA
ncbi:Aquaporin NIP2-1 [Symbiodinium microadriaticum]|uniref:Aquaporin NIP2-1 n=1 Tax=Symbiodinium microadriaticum TaxID=2951 RepID=A0A1Q9F3J6_SYMMI|nr:Aquaporin NIP2-1 [Symbiodinium microadriaticum]